MPRPGQPGAHLFDGKRITRFLRGWELDCDDFGLTDVQRCERLPFYCTEEIERIVWCLPGYADSNWETLKLELKDLYWEEEEHEDTLASLNELVRSARNGLISLSAYLLQYEAISRRLVNIGELSTRERIHKLVDGLSEAHKDKAWTFMIKQKWKLLADDPVNDKVPDFKELKEFLSDCLG